MQNIDFQTSIVVRIKVYGSPSQQSGNALYPLIHPLILIHKINELYDQNCLKSYRMKISNFLENITKCAIVLKIH